MMGIKWPLAILVLDDRPGDARWAFKGLLETLDAELISQSNDPDVCDTYLLRGWEFGEDIEISVTILGETKREVIGRLSSVEDLSRFDIAFIDQRWEKLVAPTFAAEDFGRLAQDFNGLGGVQRAGLLLARFAKDSAPDLITVVISQEDIDLRSVKWAIQRAGAFQFLRKGDIISLFNVLVYCMDQVRRRTTPTAVAKVIRTNMTARERAAQAAWGANNSWARLLSSLPDPGGPAISIEALEKETGQPEELIRHQIDRLNPDLAFYNIVVNVDGDKLSMREI